MSQSFKLPDLGEGIHEGEIVSILVAVGDEIKEDQPLLVVETDKAAVEIPSPFSGIVSQINVQPGDMVYVGDVLVVFGDGEAPATPKPTPARVAEVSQAAPMPHEGPVPASPATRRLARELGVDLRQVPPSGSVGLVTAEDVRGFAAAPAEVESAQAEAPLSTPAPPSAVRPLSPFVTEVPPLPDFTRWGPVGRIPLRSVRRATAKHMALAWSQVPHVNHQDLADVTALNALRRKHKTAVEAQGGKLTMIPFVLKAVVATLKAFPQFNASLDVNTEEIVLKQYYHLGVAVDTERGLLVPVVRDVDSKSINELAVELVGLVERTRAGQVTLEEMQGGTFTITNIGALGGTVFAPIVNYPEVAILGMGKAQLRPTVRSKKKKDGYKIVPRLIMPVVMAFDHRVLDGAEAARFVRAVIDLLENPEKLLLAV